MCPREAGHVGHEFFIVFVGAGDHQCKIHVNVERRHQKGTRLKIRTLSCHGFSSNNALLPRSATHGKLGAQSNIHI